MTVSEAPTTALGAGSGFVVQLDAFSGPLDLLLHLLREEQLEISDIPIARIADQFLLAIHDLGLNQAADYLDMASRLVRLKAQMLLPRRSEEDGWEDPRAELVRRLLEYQQIREIAVWMGRVGRAARRAVRPRLPAAATGAAAAAAHARPAGAAAGGGAGDRRHPVAGAAPRGGPAARRRGRHAPDRAAARGAGGDSAGSRRSAPGPRSSTCFPPCWRCSNSPSGALLRLAQPAAFAPMVIARDPARPAA